MSLREINLIPADILAQRRRRRRLRFWGGCLAAGLALIAGTYLYQTRVILARDRALFSLEGMESNLKLQIEEIRRIDLDLQTLHQQQSILKTISRNQPYTGVLSRLAEILNEATWFTQISIEEGGKKGEETRISLAGFAFGNDRLADFMSRLATQGSFGGVELKFASEVELLRRQGEPGGKTKAIQFQIDCLLRGS